MGGKSRAIRRCVSSDSDGGRRLRLHVLVPNEAGKIPQAQTLAQSGPGQHHRYLTFTSQHSLYTLMIAGKDITQKLYSLNEHLTGLTAERKREKSVEQWTRAHNRSMSVDAVNTGTTGFVRSEHFLGSDRQSSFKSGSSECKFLL